ncbi:MAG: hypothetical protein A3G41_04630 [Elusimicrobia bacterium RIFCSPLOWO2_12_FULL_59_9]|nr:MAG: hypothetical protein A3G41_04630 [Elusimicrobia bacterium RIFCSPLOWO2_12_FULL_59_9]
MTRVQLLEREIKKLDRANLAAFRNWFRKYDAEAWDRQVERDVHAGRLDKFAAEAFAARKAGKTREI